MLERVREVNKRPAPEESIALRVAVLVAVVVAALAVLGQDVGGGALRAAVLVGIPGGFAFSHYARYREGFWLKVGLAIALLVVFLNFLRSLAGIGPGTLSEVQVPLAELFLWVQLLHALDVPARRDLMFSLVSSLVLMAVAGVLSISLTFGFFFVVWAVAAVASLTLAHRSELAEYPRLGSTAIAVADARGVFRSVAGVVALVLLLGTGLFLVLPAAGSARALTFPAELPEAVPSGGLPGALSNPTLGRNDPTGGSSGGEGRGEGESFGYFGFSTELDTSVRGRPDDTVVMRVRATAPDFWRGQTFDVWDGRTWKVGSDDPEPIRGAAPIDIPVGREDVLVRNGREFVQTYYLDKSQPNLIFGAYAMTQLYFPDNTVFQLPDGTLRAGVGLGDGAIYTVVSRRPPVTEEVLRSAGLVSATATGLSEEMAAQYLQLPEVPERVRDLARDVTAGAPSTYDQVQALIAWMEANTSYTLDIPPLPRGADAVEQYLFEDKQGFCEQIATALVVMMRSLGVPARLGVGYAPGERNPFTGLFEVKASDAHAWTEIYFPGIGWQIFDPTASVPLAGDGGLTRASSGIGSFLAARLPAIPAALSRVLVAIVVIGVLAAVGAQVLGRTARRRRLASRSWPVVWQARLDEVGAECGRPRKDSESLREYVEVLRHLLPHDSWHEAVRVVEVEAFSLEANVADRLEAERVLAEVGASRRK
jgi:transglutaminase-like putative cysteine protease